MTSFTIQNIMDLDPCYDREHVEDLFNGSPSLTLHEILDLDIPAEDRIWAWRQLVSEKQSRLFDCDCAESRLPLFEGAHPNDDRPREAIEVARLYAEGEATKEELRKAYNDAIAARARAGAFGRARTAANAAAVATCASDVDNTEVATASVYEQHKQIRFAWKRS